MTENVLEEANRLVSNDRGPDYGHPYDDFSRAAKIWSAVLGIEVTPEQVGLCQIGTKIAREVNKPKRDNKTDIAGYARCLELIEERRERRTGRLAEPPAPTHVLYEPPANTHIDDRDPDAHEAVNLGPRRRVRGATRDGWRDVILAEPRGEG
jgi:hypothetical protein